MAAAQLSSAAAAGWLGAPPALVDAIDARVLTATVEARLFGSAPRVCLGRYEIHRVVSRGVGGTVYRGRDPVLDRPIAVKVLTSALSARFRSGEAEGLARLSHPNVVTIFDVLTLGSSNVALVMEWIDGVPLDHWAAQARPSRSAILELCVDLGRGLAAVHAAGWLHRDVKPANALVGRDGRVRLVDFGLACRIDEDHDSGAFGNPSRRPPGTSVGTPAYMAPEVRRTGCIDARADQYSFCVATHEALMGVHLDAIASLDPHHSSDKIPRHIRHALARGLHADPSARFPSMDSLVDALTAGAKTSGRAYIGAAMIACTLAYATFASPPQVDVVTRVFSSASEDFAAANATITPRERDRVDSSNLTQPRKTAADLEATFASAVEDGLDYEAAVAATNLVFLVGYASADAETGRRWARHAQSFLDRLDGHARLQAELDSHLGSVESRAGHYARAEQLHRRAESTRRTLGLEGRLALASTLNNLGNLFILQGNFEQATQYHEEALALRKKVLGPADRFVAISLNNLAAIELRARHFERAEALLQQALTAFEASLGPEHPELTHVLINLAMLATMRHEGSLAETLARRALSIAEATHGPDDPLVGMAQQMIGKALHEQGHLDDALTELFAALHLMQAALGNEHDDIAKIHRDLGSVYSAQGRPAAALEHATLAFEHRRTHFGMAHHGTAIAGLKAGQAAIELGDAGAALKWLTALVHGPGFAQLDDAERQEAEHALQQATKLTAQRTGSLAQPGETQRP